MRINFDFGDLEAFLAVMESGSFHVAAQALNLSQSAITRRIQKLEFALDSELFERTTRAVRPTLAAKRLRARADSMIGDARETTLAMRDESVALAHQRNAVVTLAITPTIVARILPDSIRNFRAAGYAARIRFVDLAAREVAEAVSQGEADFGICSVPVAERGCAFEPLFDDPMVLALPPGHPLADREELVWADLESEALILPGRGTGNRLLIDDATARARMPRNWTYEVQRSTTALELVLAGSGIAIVPGSSITLAVAADLVTRPLPAPGIVRPLGFLMRIGQADTPAVAGLKTAIRAAI